MAVSFLSAKTTGQCTVRQETAFHAITFHRPFGAKNFLAKKFDKPSK